MLRNILNKSWKQHSTRQKLYGHLRLIFKTIQIKRTRHAGHSWRSKDELISWPLHMDVPVLADQQELTYNSSVRTQNVVWKTCRERWMIGTNDERVWEIRASCATWWWRTISKTDNVENVLLLRMINWVWHGYLKEDATLGIFAGRVVDENNSSTPGPFPHQTAPPHLT